jgi:thiamine pyrophosphokinase
MIPYNFLERYKSILCLNGELPNKSFFATDLPIIAADGAANQLSAMGVTPDVIIGDLDSIDIKDHPHSMIISKPEQSRSDFQKALEYVEMNNLTPTLVTGVSGGFIDHILNNINVILKNDCTFYAHPILGYVLKAPTNFNIKLNKSTKISLFAMAKARVTTNGLKWNLKEDIFEFPGVNSALNRVASEDVTIEVLEGNLLVLIYTKDIADKGNE